jgi:hypothetical protein
MEHASLTLVNSYTLLTLHAAYGEEACRHNEQAGTTFPLESGCD